MWNRFDRRCAARYSPDRNRCHDTRLSDPATLVDHRSCDLLRRSSPVSSRPSPADAVGSCRAGAAARLHPLRTEVSRPRRARLSALPQGMGAAAQRARREGHRRGHVSDQGAARRDRRPHSARAGSGQHRGGGPQEPERLSRARRRARRDSRRPRLARPRLVQDDRRRLVAERHDEVARRADAPLLHRPRQPDHEGRVELGDGRRDLLRHGHAARGPHPRDRVHAEGGRRAQRRTSSGAPTS